jgi:hypothetical protein
MPAIREPVDLRDGSGRSPAVSAYARREPTQVPDAAKATAPRHLLRALEWRTGLEYVAARRGLGARRRLASRRRASRAGDPRISGRPIVDGPTA